MILKKRGDLPRMTNSQNKYLALLAKVAIAGLSRVWDFIQDVLLEWMLPPIERVVSRLVAYIKKHLPAKRPKRKRKKIKPFLKEKLLALLPPVRRVALVAVAVLVLLWNGWSLITTAATHISLSHDEVTAQPIVSDSSNSLQCSIKPIENRTSNMVVKNSGSNDFEHVEAVSSTGKKQTPIPAVYVQNDKCKISLKSYVHHERFDDRIRGLAIDISSHQQEIDWQKVAATEVNAAMIRVGYRGTESGKIFADDFYIDNIKGAQQNGLSVGVYFYTQAITPEEAMEEADFTLDQIAGYLIPLPVVIDFEFESSKDGKLTGRLYDANLSKQETTLIARAFCEKIAAAGYTPMVYGNDDMLTKHMYVEKLSKKYNIWLASYHKKAVYEGEYFFWQFTKQGIVDGIDGNVCLDYWYR